MTHGQEERLSSLLRDRALDELAALAVDTYGAELYGFLLHVVGEPASAEDVFSQMIEDVWRALPSFRGGCSVRIWLYKLAHHASVRHHRSPRDAAPRTLTAYGRTDERYAWSELRREIAPEDRALLVLRVDRKLAWDEIAQITLSESPEKTSAGAVTFEVARLRKRFQLLKDQLRVRARAAGLR